MNRAVVGAVIIAAGISARGARAEKWNPLDTVPKPLMVGAVDTSVTMGIRADCSSCHGPGNPSVRLELAKVDLLQTMPLFRDYFVFGGMQYEGCDYAKIVRRVHPNVGNPDASYLATENLFRTARHCGSRENRFPSAGNSSSGCATATPNCIGDGAVVQGLLTGQLVGFNPLAPWDNFSCQDPAFSNWCGNCTGSQTPGQPCHYTGPAAGPLTPGTWADVAAGMAGDPELKNISTCTSIGPVNLCENPIVFCDDGVSQYDVQANLLQKFMNLQWPRWYDGNITGNDVQRDLCDPIRNIYDQMAAEMRNCSRDRFVLTPDTSNWGSWCTPGTIANNACRPGSPFFGTCVCDNSDQQCQSAAVQRSSCNTPLSWKARQQVAVCDMYDRNDPQAFGALFRTVPDNVVNAGGCRENVGLFFTDGYMGGTAGVSLEATQAQPTYASFGGRSNMFVFRVSDVFRGEADRMMRSVSSNQINNSFLATDLPTMRASFAQVLNRVYKGVYTGSGIALAQDGNTFVTTSFTVPGYNGAGFPVNDDYLGWPYRVSMYNTAAPGAPIWESDWATKVGGVSMCGGLQSVGGTDPLNIGPGGTFANGVNRTVNILANRVDRNGDGTIDAHPPLRWGNMFGRADSRPVIVGEGRETASQFTRFGGGATLRQRDRSIWVMSNGYVHGIGGGRFNAGTYNANDPSAGVEFFRYRPSWVNDVQPPGRYDYTLNRLVQQPIMTGEMTAREVTINNQARTVLVGGQGRSGRGMFALDITDPCNTTLLSEWRLPNNIDSASAEPAIYTMLVPGNVAVPVVVATGGVGGSNNFYVYDITTNPATLRLTLSLGGGEYPSAPVCANVQGGRMDDTCYVVSGTGMLKRVELRFQANALQGNVRDITPPAGNLPGGADPRSGALVFSTTPAVFVGPDGAVNLIYGSGDWRNLTTPAGQNFVYKVIDRDSRTRTQGAPADIARACGLRNSTSGLITLPAGARVITAPAVAKGIVSWTTYTPQSSGCVAGQANLYAMDYVSCTDVFSPNPRPPQPQRLPDGLPTQPVLNRDTNTFMAGTSASPTGGQIAQVAAQRTRTGAQNKLVRRYWRVEGDLR